MRKTLLTGIALGLGLAFAGGANAQIKMGAGAPITGPNATFGAQLKNGVEQAVEDINAAGGILGQKIQVVIGDDVSDPKQGVSVANKFASEGVKMVVGHFNSGVSIPASEDRKSTRLNSSHANISYAVFCLKKKKNYTGSVHIRTSVTL